MNSIKKTIRLLVFICLIVLASIGIGLSGGVPIPSLKNRREPDKETIELLENQDETSDSQRGKIKG